MACISLCFLEILISDADVLNLFIISDVPIFSFVGTLSNSVMCCTVEVPLQLHEHQLQFFQPLAHKFLA
jgi:hypothetical protein